MSNMEIDARFAIERAPQPHLVMSGMRLPLNRAENNTAYVVQKVSGKDETKKHLNDLGFVEGEQVRVTSSLGGNIIVTVKGVKVALGEELAKRITVMG